MTGLQYKDKNIKSFQKWQELQQQQSYPIQVKRLTKEEIKEYHLKKLYELSLKSLGHIPRLDEPTYEQKVWVVHKMKAPESAWRSFE